jgi:hypothetical protein
LEKPLYGKTNKKYYGGSKMNSHDKMQLKLNKLNDMDSMKKEIDELNDWIDFLDSENLSYRRRLWLYFEEMVDVSNIMKKLCMEFGEERIQKIIDDYRENDRQEALEHQRRLAKDVEKNLVSIDLEELFPVEK